MIALPACLPVCLTRRRLMLALGLAATLPTWSAEPAMRLGDHPLVGRLWDARAQREIGVRELHGQLEAAEIALLGETHDNPEHHRLQARLLQWLLDQGRRPALAMEQFDSEHQAGLDAAGSNADADALASAGAFARQWGWEHYRPLVELAASRRLPLIAANLSRERARPVIRQGFAALPGGEAERLGLEAAWSPGRQDYLSRLIEDSHCGQIDATLRDGLVRGQRLRDAVMADLMLPQAGRGVVAIVGRGHARRDIGVPRYLEVRRPGTRSLSLAFVEVVAERTAATDYERERAEGIEPHDVLWFTARAERRDPCADFPQRR